MAESPPHRLGQVIGNLLEEILEPPLLKFATQGGFFLDKHGAREPIRSGKKLTWSDHYGNTHDLDFVIEKAGTPTTMGRPVAFIEAAWRRYTKHSKNKAQEIQGAILPIAEKHQWDKPFMGAVLAGEFTRPSLDQLRSVGFEVLYLPYESIVSAFDYVEIDARFDEHTADQDFKQCVDNIEKLDATDRSKLKDRLVELNKDAFERFFTALTKKLARLVERIQVLPLFGISEEFSSASEALSFITDFNATGGAISFQKFDIVVSFSNGDKIEGLFAERADAIRFITFVAS